MDEPPICGRCGYDFSGVVESWSNECPLEGTCSECGLRFAWADVFDVSAHDRAWLVEHAGTRREVVARVWRTLWRVLWPWAFWSRLPLQARVRPWVAALAMLLVLGSAHLVVNAWGVYDQLRVQYRLTSLYMGRSSQQIVPIEWSSAWAIGGAVVTGPVVAPVLDAGAKPTLVPRPVGVAQVNGMSVWIYPARASRVVLRWSGWVLPWWVLSVLVTEGMWVGLMLLLPTTRAMSKIRLAHVGRAAAYSGGMLLVLLEVSRPLMVGTWPTGTGLDWAVWSVLTGWLMAWWWCAIVTGWRTRHGRAVAWVLGFAAVLAGFVAGVWFDPYSLSGVL